MEDDYLETYKYKRKLKKRVNPPPIRKYSAPLEHGQKAIRRSWTICRTSFEVFSPRNDDQDQEVEQDAATDIQSQEDLKTKDEIKMLNLKGHLVSTILLPECYKNYQKRHQVSTILLSECYKNYQKRHQFSTLLLSECYKNYQKRHQVSTILHSELYKNY